MQKLPADDASIALALKIIEAGGVIAHATETCYGLACDLRNIDAVQKLFAIKQRPAHQPVSALFSSVEEVKKFVEWNEKAEELAQKYLPGPLTIILKMREDAPSKLFPRAEFSAQRSALETIGIRISSHPLPSSLVSRLSFPLSTTSANLHGQPNPYSAQDIEIQFKDAKVKPDLILDSGTLPQNPPSTVIDLSKETIEQRRTGGLHI